MQSAFFTKEYFMLKKLFISAILLIAVLSFVVSLLKGNNNDEKTVSIPDRVVVINIQIGRAHV